MTKVKTIKKVKRNGISARLVLYRDSEYWIKFKLSDLVIKQFTEFLYHSTRIISTKGLSIDLFRFNKGELLVAPGIINEFGEYCRYYQKDTIYQLVLELNIRD